ncbi:MAG: 3-ketoacyl-ACP reductase [Phycisphaeraceae bacterium]|nr:MAG: 3-ketoacyl-ACP reductase [Phycisphaeraceae bacterium]
MTRPVALVTGGSRGIGLGIARELAAHGFDLAINGLRPPADVQTVLDELAALGAGTRYIRLDVADTGAHDAAIDDVLGCFGRIDALVNNAGVAPSVRADILEMTPESYDRVMAINLRGPLLLSRAVAKRMLELVGAGRIDRGRIINVSSISATVASISRAEYCISKAGVAMATRLLAARLADEGIDVYEVRPGITATDMTAAVSEKYDRLIAEGLTVERRWGTPEDIGRAVAMLASGVLTYATGQVLTIDGGLTMPRL